MAHALDLMLGYLAVTHARIYVASYPDLSEFGGPDMSDFNQALPPVLARHHARLIDLHASTHAIWDNPADVNVLDTGAFPTVKGSVAIAQVVYATLHRDKVL